MHENLEYRCPICSGSVGADTAVCPICHGEISHPTVHYTETAAITPTPILVRHAAEEVGLFLDSTLEMQASSATQSVRAPTKYLIIGGGVAGATAAETLRRCDENGEITLLCAEAVPPYHRPLLSRDLSACTSDKRMPLHSAEFWQEKQIRLCCDCPVLALDTARHTAYTEGGAIAYDKCILAVGRTPYTPQIPGISLGGVQHLYTIDDGKALLARLPATERAVVLGGGILGIEIACALTQEGCQVTLIEQGDHLLGGVLHPTAADEVARILREGGMTVLCGTRLVKLQGTSKVWGATTDSEKTLLCDCVLLCCGTRPAQMPAGIDFGMERGVPVNNLMETPIPDLYACGDCADTAHTPNPYAVQFAKETATVAAKNAAGEHTAHLPHTPRVAVTALAGRAFCMVGDAGAKEGVSYQTVTYQTEAPASFSKFFFLEERLVGAALFGDTHALAALKDAIARGLPFRDFCATHAFHPISKVTLA